MKQISKRFLFLITHYKPVVYGAELFASKIAETLVKHGHKVDVVTGKWQKDWPTVELIQGVRVHRVPVVKTRFIQTIYFIWPQWRHSLRLLKANNYDAIHAHIFPSLITGSLLPNHAQKIVTVQGGDLADYPEIYGPFAPIFKKLISSSLKQYDIIHCVSSDLASQVKEMTNRTAIIIPNGVDANLLTNTVASNRKLKQKFPDTNYVAYSPSRLTDKNNLLETVQAIAMLQDKRIDIGLVIAGEGHLESKIRSLIKSLKIEDKVRLIGRISHQESLLLTSQADVLVRVSTQEGFGISLLEGLALGTPVVTSLSGGLKDFISTEYAYVAKSYKAEAIAESLQQAITDKSHSKKMALGKSMVREKYTWDKVSDQVLKLYT